MQSTTLHVHTKFHIGAVDPRLFGGFLEHMGRAVHEGIYHPSSLHADADGLRQDVLDQLRRLAMTAMRYPGGNFASGYHWQDGVGPRQARPTVRELAWQSIETNHFGTDEFIALCRKMGWTPMLTVNLGTGSPEEARNWVEYCNSPCGTRYADLRAANGNGEPHAVKLWCLGNEMDGAWQLGHVPAREYAIRAQQAAKMMKDTDPSIELVAAGSCSPAMPSYMEWDREVLDYLGDAADYVSLHRYVGNAADDTPAYLAVTADIDRQIQQMDAACRFVQAKGRRRKRAWLCFDEWNVWYKNHQTNGAGTFAPHLIEEIYNLEDALVVAGFLQSFLRHADVLKIANLAQIVNVIAPLLTDGDRLLVQSIFHPFAMISSRREGISLRLAVEGPGVEMAEHGKVPNIDASAILGDGCLQLFLTNRSMDHDAEVDIRLANATILALENGELLTAADAKAANTWEAPTTVAPVPFSDLKVRPSGACCRLPPLSFVAMTLRLG